MKECDFQKYNGGTMFKEGEKVNIFLVLF